MLLQLSATIVLMIFGGTIGVRGGLLEPASQGSLEKILNCEFTKYANTFYLTDYFDTTPGYATQFKSLDECLSYCLLRPQCKSINVKDANFQCTFHSSSTQEADAGEAIKTAKAKTFYGWTHYKIVSCPEETSTSPVGCGIQASTFMPSFTRIIGGQEARANSWPWQTFLMATSDTDVTLICGSSLLRVKDNVEASDILLTAGHCVTYLVENSKTHAFYKPNQMTAVFGTHDRTKYQAGVQVRLGDKIVAAPDFNLSQIINDIALIRLSKPVKFTNKIRPICLPAQGDTLPVGKLCAAAGWGRVNSTTLELSTVLNELSMTVHNATVCRNGWGNVYIENQMVCAGNLNGDSGTCSGDSGGMLACKESGKWVLYGATSFGVKDICIQANKPKMFARVSSYVDWIKTTMAALTTL